MKITYPEPVSVTLIYDDAFKVYFYETWDELLVTIKENIDQHGFKKCKVVSSETGRILMVVVND